MTFSLTILDLAGAVALLLWGMRMIQTGVQRTFGTQLRGFLDSALRNRFKAFLAGMGVTAVLQSSTATGLMVTGFAAGGLVELVPALAVMLGANVGTTLIVQLLSFNVVAISPVLILAGVLMFRRATAGLRDFGRVLIGLGLVLLALHQFLSLLAPDEDLPVLRLMLGSAATQPILDLILAAIVTWATHSSVVVVLMIMSFASKGIVPPEAALALVLGANLGSAVNPLLEGTTSDDPAAKRLPLGNLMNRVLGVAVALPLLPYLGRLMTIIDPDAARAVADFHTLFNLVLAAAFFPLLGPYAGLLRRWLPTRIAPIDPARPMYLDPSAREAPAVALGGAAREALRLADVLEAMLQGLRDAFTRGDRRRVTETKPMADVLDKLNTAIKTYLSRLDPEAMTDADQRRVQEILCFAVNMEHAGDIVEYNLLGLVAKTIKHGLFLSKEGQAELLEVIDRLIANVQTAASLFITEDARAARLLVAEKAAFRSIEAQATSVHFERLRTRRVETAGTSSIHLAMLRDLKRVNTHLVAAAAYPVLESKGELFPSRMRQDGPNKGGLE
jgi:phosphate:Na+ symporter